MSELIIFPPLVRHRSGVLQPEDLEKEYEDDLDFLFAKLKLAQENKKVR